ncbi:MAG TPA: endonuclease/exonuclease/phosphatase family protein [Thermoleophilaceae bacterium]
MRFFARPLALTAALTALIAVAAPSAQAAKGPTITVMTRNLFLGADLIPLATSPPGQQFEQAATNMFAGVTAADPTARMKLVAGEIAKAKPDLVGFQELSLWRTGPHPASKVAYDYIATILSQLKRLHQHYRVVAIKQAFNVEGPMSSSNDVRLTLGDAIIARKGVKVKHARSGVFKQQLTIPTQAIGNVVTNRGWNSLDATVHGVTVHVVNTHLEAYSADFRLKQAQELVRGPLRSKLPTILLGDLNSGPNLPKPEDRPPYLAIAKAGFKEERTPKFSCCFNELTDKSGWDHNVDHIMAKPKLKLVRSFITGAETTPAGVHPSDHGGVVSVLRLKR